MSIAPVPVDIVAGASGGDGSQEIPVLDSGNDARTDGNAPTGSAQIFGWAGDTAARRPAAETVIGNRAPPRRTRTSAATPLGTSSCASCQARQGPGGSACPAPDDVLAVADTADETDSDDRVVSTVAAARSLGPEDVTVAQARPMRRAPGGVGGLRAVEDVYRDRQPPVVWDLGALVAPDRVDRVETSEPEDHDLPAVRDVERGRGGARPDAPRPPKPSRRHEPSNKRPRTTWGDVSGDAA